MKWINELRLRTKLTFLILIIIFCMTSLSFYIMQRSSQAYNSTLNEQTASLLSLYATNFEQYLDNYNSVSYNIIIDDDLQNYLSSISENAYNNFRINEMIEKRLLKYIQSNKFISSIHIIDSNENVHTSGLSLPKMNYKEIQKESSQYEGKIFWKVDRNYPDKLLLIREIRKIESMSLNSIGTIVIAVNLDRLTDIIKDKNNVDPIILIYNDQTFIYSSNSIISFPLDTISPLNKPTQTKVINGQKYLLSISSNDTTFTYVQLVPYDEIFNLLSTLQKELLAIIAVLSFAFLFLGIVYSYTVTKPLENLCRIMKTIETNDFKITESLDNQEIVGYEMHLLYSQFISLLNKMDYLINEQLKSELLHANTKYSMLQSQINPHFLYNTLDSINWLARIKKEDKIANMIKSLAMILRVSIDSKDTKTTITQEIELINAYVYIQQIRYGERLNYSYFYDPQVINGLLPKMMIQPLIENAIQYVLEPTEDICHIQLVIRKKDNCLKVTISDDGSGMKASDIEAVLTGNFTPKGNGIGIKNILERLKLIYKTNYQFNMFLNENGGISVNIIIPLELKGEISENV